MNFQELKRYARMRCGIEEDDAISDEELGLYLNMSLGNLDSILCTAYEDYRLTRYLASVSGTNTIPLPPDFLKLRAVDFGSPGLWITIFSFGLQQRNRLQNPIGAVFAPYGSNTARAVRVMDNKIFVEPENLASGTYQIWYTPKFQHLRLPTDPLPIEMDTEGWQEYAVASAGVKIYNKLNLSTTGFAAEVSYHENMVRAAAKNRMSSGPKTMQNVRRGGRFGVGGSGSGSGL